MISFFWVLSIYWVPAMFPQNTNRNKQKRCNPFIPKTLNLLFCRLTFIITSIYLGQRVLDLSN